jgi:indole-3-glycerol phosphate synthase/phosphoribosylanthranilate isomerase
MALDAILARTREDLARRKRERPLGSLPSPPPDRRSLVRALRRERSAFILECKRASPSEGLIRAGYDPAALAAVYAPHADAISVLTDTPFFGGSLEHLRAVREAVPVPVLRKDFIIDPYQVIEARAWGADAVLLMLSVLDDGGWRECAAAAREAGLDSLTEVHSEAELERALQLGASLIGINNRNLGTLTVDLDTTRRLAPRVPADRTLVAESGIRSSADVRALAPLVDGFLVGTALMRHSDLAGAVRRLVYGVTKVCGLTRVEDARTAWTCGATYGGLIFAAESPRRVDNSRALELTAAVPLAWVGVFVNQDPETIGPVARDLGLAAVQLHGEESPEMVAMVRRTVPAGCEVWKAVRVRDRVPGVRETGADRLVLDTWRDGRRGGTGERFDWSLVEGHPDRPSLLLGGGLTPALAASASRLATWGLDVNSGVEDAPGLKSAGKLAAFFEGRRAPGRRRDSP